MYGLKQVVHLSWLGILETGNEPDIAVTEFDNLPFERKHHAGCGHDEDEHTSRNTYRKM